MARLRLSFGLLVVLLVACESAPQSKPQDGSGELPSEDRKSLESEGFLPRRRFGDPPLISGLPEGGFNPLPDGAPWMSESGDPVFPAYDDDDDDNKERKKEEDVEDNKIPKRVDDDDKSDDKPRKEHRGHKPASDEHDEEEPNSLDGIKPDKDIPHEDDDDDHSNDEEVRHKVDFEEPKFEDDEAEEDSKGEEDADEESKDEDDEDDEAEEDSKGGEDGDEDEDGGDSEEAPPFGSFMFDTPFFNVRQVSKYFQHLEKALEQVFRQTLDEATLLNGTYANTTEEEVEIDGKKFVVQKSVIQGKDNNSSIYVEALSALPKGNSSKKAVKDSGL